LALSCARSSLHVESAVCCSCTLSWICEQILCMSPVTSLCLLLVSETTLALSRSRVAWSWIWRSTLAPPASAKAPWRTWLSSSSSLGCRPATDATIDATRPATDATRPATDATISCCFGDGRDEAGDGRRRTRRGRRRTPATDATRPATDATDATRPATAGDGRDEAGDGRDDLVLLPVGLVLAVRGARRALRGVELRGVQLALELDGRGRVLGVRLHGELDVGRRHVAVGDVVALPEDLRELRVLPERDV
jgi:hypothetical protein